jgi:hypothetical protein
MHRISKFVLILSLSVVSASCRLAVIVVEGGQVQSDGYGTCAAGTICVVEVNEANFSETFEAVPDEGWYFHKWNSGDRFFCGDSLDESCPLSFEGYKESDAVEEMVASSEMFYLMPVFKPYQNIIAVDGREWIQPVLFTNLSWNDINAVCFADTGVCSGVLNDRDVTGWTWASVDDVNALFNHYIGRDELGPGPDRYHAESSGAPWATTFYADGWLPIEIDDEDAGLADGTAGWVRDKSEEGLAYWAELVDVLLPVPDPPDLAITDNKRDVLTGAVDVGGWFYRIP